MKLYKFRSLQQFDRIEDILTNKRFFLSSWKELNDPMEGYFHYVIFDSDLPYKNIIDQFISEKTQLRICSFSNTYKPILLWSHYADSHNGIAIEVTLNSRDYDSLYRVRYRKNIPELNFMNNPTPIDVLTSKINFWDYEREYRVIQKTSNINIGQITGIYFGTRTSDYNKEKVKSLIDSTIPIFDTKIDFNKNIIEIKNA
ncbi:MAG: hypothetical protein HYZ10_10290 [Ignavibacteriales bacterium]|nr:hypothetical protein [Ignavibacteriales bacterium]